MTLGRRNPEHLRNTRELTPEGAAARHEWEEQCLRSSVDARKDWNAIASAAIEASDEVKRLLLAMHRADGCLERGDAKNAREILIQALVEFEVPNA